VQRQTRTASPANPHGQGFIAPTRTNRAGKIAVRSAREIATYRSSSGCEPFERVPRELRHLVEKEHAVMCEAHFTRAGLHAAADERGG
jgi:hypothetical protein